MHDHNRGQAVVMIVMVVAVICSVGVALTSLGVRMAHRQQAQSAADAAALAGASFGREASIAVATSNGASLLEYHDEANADGVTVTVVVAVAGERATSRASTAPDMRVAPRSDHSRSLHSPR